VLKETPHHPGKISGHDNPVNNYPNPVGKKYLLWNRFIVYKI